MRKDGVLKISPAASVGNRSNVRTTVPKTLQPFRTDEPMFNLRENGEERTSLVVQLCRTFGLRFKEASLLDANRTLKEAKRYGRINITEGTKGGRGKGADRWVPASNEQLSLLTQADELQRLHDTRNLIPPTSSYKEWRYHAYYAWREATKGTPISGFHDVRAAYACERYQQITHCPAPVVTGRRQASKELDRQARIILSGELGHGRTDVLGRMFPSRHAFLAGKRELRN